MTHLPRDSLFLWCEALFSSLDVQPTSQGLKWL
jgi:hypothetical protein